MEYSLAKAHKDKQLAEVERYSLRRGTECLTAKVETLEREAHSGKGGRAPGPSAKGEAQSLTAERVPTQPAHGSSWLGRTRGMRTPRQHLERCQPSPRAYAWHCCTRRCTWRSFPNYAGSHRRITNSCGGTPPSPTSWLRRWTATS